MNECENKFVFSLTYLYLCKQSKKTNKLKRQIDYEDKLRSALCRTSRGCEML